MQENLAESNFYSFNIKTLQDGILNFSDLMGKAVFIVNTATRCGLTPQLTELQKLQQTYGSKGLVILGVPSNSFKQEDKDGEILADFCQKNFGVEFTMLELSQVTGKKRIPLYDFLIKNSKTPDAEISWNFEKFLVDRQGKVSHRFAPQTSPLADEVVNAISTALDKKLGKK
ncbi:MAG: glutathione peroxidase [Oligoflexales bacterium]|nr:glutathione peroxidase [Oligoflexales bacterium]